MRKAIYEREFLKLETEDAHKCIISIVVGSKSLYFSKQNSFISLKPWLEISSWI